MSPLLLSIVIGVIGTFVAVPIVLAIGQMFQLWRVLPERTVLVYTFFGKVVGQVEEPGLFFPIAHFGPKALLFPLFGKAYPVRTVIHQAYLRNQLVNSEEGAPMGVGIWFEMFVKEPKAFLFQNSDPIGSLKANVATAVVKQLSNLRLEVLLENRADLFPMGLQPRLDLHPQSRLPRQGHDRRDPAQGRQPPPPGHRRDAPSRRKRSRDHPLRR
jgi:hypothetical protein